MHTPVRKVKEKGLIFIAMDGRDSFVGEVVGQVFVGLKPMPRVVAHAKAHVGPQKFVDGVKVLLGVHDTWIVLRQVQPAFHEQALIKTLVARSHFGGAAQVPFTDMQGVITALFERFGHGDFGGRHTQIIEIFGAFGSLFVNHHFARSVGVRIQLTGHASHRTRRGCELHAKPPRIAPCQQCRTRHGANRAAGIALVKTHAVSGDGINMGRWHALRRMASACGGDVIDTQVVSQNKNDVGRAFAHWRSGRLRTLHPGRLLVRIAGMADIGVPTQ